MNNILARNEANAAGAEEAIMLNDRGRIAEGSADNVFIVRDGQLITPPTSEGALAGITRRVVMELALELNIPVLESPLTPFDLVTSDECFLTGSGAELIPVRQVGGAVLGSERTIFRKLQTAFRNRVAEPSRDTISAA